ncbi:MAG: hypothetical protein PHS04_16105 [Tissierellia bacterium]|jgi:hypothetical protein|nr:hypothetical protein [Tissierellia bacterium]
MKAVVKDSIGVGALTLYLNYEMLIKIDHFRIIQLVHYFYR